MWMDRAVSDWLVANNIVEALAAAALDPGLTSSQQRSIAQAGTVVGRFHDKVPPRVVNDPPPARRVKLFLKHDPMLPSHGVLLMDADANTVTVRELFTFAATALHHPATALHVETQSGKHVRQRVSGLWNVFVLQYV